MNLAGVVTLLLDCFGIRMLQMHHLKYRQDLPAFLMQSAVDLRVAWHVHLVAHLVVALSVPLRSEGPTILQ